MVLSAPPLGPTRAVILPDLSSTETLGGPPPQASSGTGRSLPGG